MELHYAEIMDNNSPLKNGSVQIRVPYLMDGILSNDLPWALPFDLGTGGSNDCGTSKIPEVGSLVWVFFYDEVYQKKPYYIAGINLENFGPHKLFDQEVKSNITGWSSSYPDVKYEYYKNGVCIAVSSDVANPEVAIFHPTGSAIFISKLGEITLQTKDAMTWCPNSLPNCLFSSAPHGGVGAGIIKLKGA